MKTNKNNMLCKDTLDDEEEPDCSQCPEEPCHCQYGLERMLEQADRLYDEKRDREVGI
jgi:hypothetical protein